MIPTQPFVLAEDLGLEAKAKKLAKELHLLYKGNFQDLKKQYKDFRDIIEKKYFFIKFSFRGRQILFKTWFKFS